MKNRLSQRRPVGRTLLIALAVILVSSCVIWLGAGSDPRQSLAEARSLIEQKNAEKALDVIDGAAHDKTIEPWILLTKAEALELTGKAEDAAAVYQDIPAESAASLDAQIALIRLGQGAQGKNGSELGSYLTALEQKLRKARRQDLLPDLYFFKASVAERDGDQALATALYRQTRVNYPGTKAAKASRESEQRLLAVKPEEAQKASPADLLSEAELLIKEGEAIAALDYAQRARSQTTENSPAYFESLLGQEQALRQLKRTQEADNLLSIVAAGGGLGTADRALTAMIKQAWNANENERALDLISSFSSRFPAHKELGNMLYIKGRILGDKGQIADAKVIYQEISERAEKETDRIRGLRQLAWIDYRRGDFVQAAQHFSRAARLAQSLINREITEEEGNSFSTPSKQLTEEFFHNSYWYALSMKSSGKEEAAAKGEQTSPSAIWQTVAAEQPFGYYGLLSSLNLASDAPVFSGASLKDSQASSCFLDLPDNLLLSLQALHSSGLRSFAQAEIDWYLSNLPAQNDKNANASLLNDLTRTRLYAEYAFLNKGVAKANSFLQSLSFSHGQKKELERCKMSLISLSYSRPYLEEFKKASVENHVPLSLLLAMARTESHFDAKAISKKDARGLLQLLQKTAVDEGMKEGQDLFDPSVNIAFAAKHIARLLDRYSGNKVETIAAYNAGVIAVDSWKSRFPNVETQTWIELITYPETNNYVKEVLTAERFYDKLLK